jgi:hypothetical protein
MNSNQQPKESKMKAKITPHGVKAENGEHFEFLGSGQRYGFDSTYAVARPGQIAVPAHSMGWPYNQNEVWIEEAR